MRDDGPVSTDDGTDQSPDDGTDDSTEVSTEASTRAGPRADAHLRRPRPAGRAARRAGRPGLRGADADPAGGHPAAARGPRPARPGRHRHRQDRGVRAADPAAAAGRRPRQAPTAMVLVPTRELVHAGVRGAAPLRPRARRPGAADLRRPADRPPAARAASAASTSSSPPPAARSTTSTAARSTWTPSPSSCSTRPTRCSTWASPRTSRRSCGATPSDAADRAVLGHHAAADRRDRPAPPARPGAHRDRARGAGVRARRRWSARPRTSSRGRTSRPRSAGCSTSRRRPRRSCSAAPASEVDELTETLNGRGYRAEALHGGMNQEQRDRVMGRLRAGTADLLVATDVAARGPRHRPPHPRRQLRRAVGARVLRAPDRPGRPRRPRGRGDHAGRAARAPDAQDHRAGDPAADPGREGADRRRPAGPAARADPGRAAREPARGRPRAVPRRGRDADRRLRRHAGRARRGEARARGDRRRLGRRGARSRRRPCPAGDAGRRPAAGGAGATRAAPAAGGAWPRRTRARAWPGSSSRSAGPPGIRPAGPGRRDRRRVPADRPGHRRDRDHRPVLAGRGAGQPRPTRCCRRCAPPGSRAARSPSAATATRPVGSARAAAPPRASRATPVSGTRGWRSRTARPRTTSAAGCRTPGCRRRP